MPVAIEIEVNEWLPWSSQLRILGRGYFGVFTSVCECVKSEVAGGG